jgi:FkbM family methyltransferase
MIKKIIKQLTPPIIWKIGRKLTFREPIFESKYHSLHDLDKKIERYLDHSNGFYVELGANDGITQSNTLYFEKYKNWSGILVEPSPNNYLKCLANRSNKNYIFCNACVSFDFKDKFVEIAFSNLMSTPFGLESDISDPISNATSGEQFLDNSEVVFTFGAIAKTLNEILIISKAPNVIDFMSLDVEGAEIEVLKGIDHRTFRFKYLCIECRDIIKLTTYLNGLDYELIEQLTKHDYLFLDKLNR